MVDLSGVIPSPTNAKTGITNPIRIENVKHVPSDTIPIYIYHKNNSASSSRQYNGSHVSLSEMENVSGIINHLRVITSNAEILLSKIIEQSINRGFDSISNDVISFSKKTIIHLNTKGLSLHNVFPISEGGIGVELNKDDFYINISYFNDGYATYYKEKEGETPSAWELDFNSIFSKVTETI